MAEARSRRSSRSAGVMQVSGGKAAVALKLEEGLTVGGGGEMVEDLDALGGLFQGEVAHIRDEHGELLLVVWAAEGLGGGLDDDDAGLGGWLFGERSGAVGVAVVGDVDPAAGADVGGGGLGGGDEVGEEGHGMTLTGVGNGCFIARREAPGLVGGMNGERA